jgi:hypothetical protein
MKNNVQKGIIEPLFEDGYKWDLIDINENKKLPVFFHGTREFFLEGIKEKGLIPNGIDELVESNEYNDVTAFLTKIYDFHQNSYSERKKYVSISLSYKVALNHAKQGPEHIKEFNTELQKIMRELDIRYPLKMIKKYENMFLKYHELQEKIQSTKPIILTIKPDYKSSDLVSFEHKNDELAKYFFNKLFRKQFINSFQKKQSFNASLKSDNLGIINDISKSIELYFRSTSYCIDLLKIPRNQITNVKYIQ